MSDKDPGKRPGKNSSKVIRPGKTVWVSRNLSHPVFKTKTRCSSYVCPGSSCHTYGQNVST
jgi:hypothetical protein